jgi:hypothetical protein
MDSNSLPKGFISVDEAVKLIESNTFNNPVVDINYLIHHLDWCEVAHNFTIPKVRIATAEEYKALLARYPGRRPSELIRLGNLTVTLYSNYEVEYLKKTIRDNYAKVSGHQYKPVMTKGVTTVKDQGENDSVAPRRTKKTVAKEGDTIGIGAISDTNSADGAGV